MAVAARSRPTVPNLSLPGPSTSKANPFVDPSIVPRGPRSPLVSTNTKSSQQDYSRWPPDELFARLSVTEVKGIHSKLRSEADAKQEELRTMVGERYRDLLQASTSIITISTESQHVTRALEEVESALAPDDNEAIQTIPRQAARKIGVDEAELATLQSLSAHLKLMLDAPEQLWRLLEQHDYLHAAWLFLVSRVVYRSLMRDESSEDDDTEISWVKSDIRTAAQFPLAQRQWDTISQFRNQISHKATQSLRMSRTPREVCNTLVAILLLDSIPVSETVTLFLSQRSKALRSLLTKVSPDTQIGPAMHSSSPRQPSPHRLDPKTLNRGSSVSKSASPSPSPAGRRSTTPSDIPNPRRSKAAHREAITAAKDALSQALDLIAGTVETVRAIFGADDVFTGSRPLVEEILESVQSSPISPTTSKKRPRHHARMSIISSFHATPLPLPASSSDGPSTHFEPLTTASILESLPSSHLLLQFLPPSIVSYSPYIDTLSASAQLSSRSHLAQASSGWFDSALSSLKSHLTGWFQSLDSLRALWETRVVLSEVERRLTKAESAKLKTLFDEASRERAKEIWSSKLISIEKLAENLVKEAAKSIEEGDSKGLASDPLSYPLSQAPLPSFTLPSSSAVGSISGVSVKPQPQPQTQSISFLSYRTALQHRIDARPPLLDDTVSALESSAHEMRKDFDFISRHSETRRLVEELEAEYTQRAEASISVVARSLEAFLVEPALGSTNGEMTGSTSDKASDFSKIEIFVVRLALELHDASSFVSDLTRHHKGSSSAYSRCLKELSSIISRLLEIWRASSVEAATSAYASTVESSSMTIEVPKRASSALMQALLSLIDSIRRLGLPQATLHSHDLSQRIVGGLLSRLEETAKSSPDTQREWDVACVKAMLQTFSSSRPGETNGHHHPTEPKERLESIHTQIASWQLFLAPLLGNNGSGFIPVKPLDVLEKNSTSSLLQFGAPLVQEDFNPAVDMVKPGPRFGTLLVGGSTFRKGSTSIITSARR